MDHTDTSKPVGLFESINPFPHRAVIFHEDWHAFVTTKPPAKPDMPKYEEYLAMAKAEKRAFNSARLRFHQTFGPIEVAAMRSIHQAGLRLATQNLHALPGARPGIIINGLGNAGKTTIAMQLGRRYELGVTKNRQITKTPGGDLFIPVVYISLPGEISISNFNWLFVDFYNIPAPKSAKDAWLTGRILEYAARCCTSLVILDDIHFLKIKNRSHAVVNNHIKQFANNISATFVYAGIDCEGGDLLNEGNSVEKANLSQTGHRFKKFDVDQYSLIDKHAEQFYTLLDYFESQLLLFRQKKGSLRRHAKYIMDRTGGFIGGISDLLRETPTLAIQSGDEEITPKLMDRVKLDFFAEQRYRQVQRSAKARHQHCEE